MTYDRVEKTRRAAILIASLDETMAEQLLAGLPPAEAAKVAAELQRLDDVDPEEQRDVLDEFRRAGRTAQSRREGVEFTYSAPRVVAPPVERPAETPADAPTTDAPHDGDAAAIAELLAHEHPQTIAVALSGLGQEQAAGAFAALPSMLQADVLERLANLQTADEGAVQELQRQLKQRIEEQRARRERMAASIELAKRMLAKTAPEQRESLLARITPRRPLEPRPAEAGASESTSPAVPRSPDSAGETELYLADGQRRDEHGPSAAWPADEDPAEPPYAQFALAAAPDLEDRSAQLEGLTDAELFGALRAADEATVQRALAASSEALVNRVASRLPRRQANRLRRLVRSLGPTRLSDLRTAQWQLLRLARPGEPLAAAL
ncbi:MAG: hypothetical protein DCC67_08635 [Planctomycetota bacterium]|nr:MAG: hypothetical protein DCC67_08635 [Planctomycetota bacterium]